MAKRKPVAYRLSQLRLVHIYDDRAMGVTDEWWRQTLDRLSKWRAFRGPKPPNSKDQIDRCVKKILEWNRFKRKNEARKRLIQAMNLREPLHPYYPLETKIMELSHIGRKHG